jgi:hypothetical protein
MLNIPDHLATLRNTRDGKNAYGPFLLDDGLGRSRPTFFKLTPAGGADTAGREAKILQHKLLHIKVCADLIAGDRSLLVTQKVGDSNERPISLAAFLEKASDHVQPALPGIVERVANQVAALGDLSPYQTSLRNLLWPHHDQERLRALCKGYSERHDRAIDRSLDVDPSQCDPTSVLEILSKNTVQVRFKRQTCLHGDLNITNISLDDSAMGPSADIFDAEGCQPGVNVRDLAMLEVTALLHQPADGEPSLVQHCKILYRNQVDLPDDLDYTQGPNRARNTFKLLAEIRKQALKQADPSIYALMVFDCAMLQLGGLAWPSRNKITHPQDAALLGTLTANWLRQVAPEFFGYHELQS